MENFEQLTEMILRSFLRFSFENVFWTNFSCKHCIRLFTRTHEIHFIVCINVFQQISNRTFYRQFHGDSHRFLPVSFFIQRLLVSMCMAWSEIQFWLKKPKFYEYLRYRNNRIRYEYIILVYFGAKGTRRIRNESDFRVKQIRCWYSSPSSKDVKNQVQFVFAFFVFVKSSALAYERVNIIWMLKLKPELLFNWMLDEFFNFPFLFLIRCDIVCG